MKEKGEGDSGNIFSLLTVNYNYKSEICKLSSVQAVKHQHHEIFNKVWILKRFISRLNFKQIITCVLKPRVSFVWKEVSECQYIWPGTF